MLQQKWILVVFLSLTLVGCATTKADWEKSQKLDTVCGYQEFLKKYPRSEFADEAKHRIENLEWQRAKLIDTIESYQEFISKYTQGKFSRKAKARIEALEFQKAINRKGVEGYKKFFEKYPKSKLAAQAREKVELLEWQKAKTVNSYKAYNEFLVRYPLSRFAEEAKEKKGQFIEEAEEIIQSKKNLTDCEPASQMLVYQIERDVAKFVGIEEGESLIVDAVNFKLNVIGFSEQGEAADLTTYVSAEKKGEIFTAYFISTNRLTSGKPIKYSIDGEWYPAKKVVSYRKVINPGSMIVLRDGREFTYMDGKWNLCPGKIKR